MMTSTIITLICLIVVLYGGTVAVLMKALNQKDTGEGLDEVEEESSYDSVS